MSKIIFDTNNLAMRCVHITDVKTVDKKSKKVINVDFDYWKYLVVNSIYTSLYQTKGITEVVLAVDDKSSWRYDIWDRYKEDRKRKKKESTDDFPWDTFFIKYNELLDEIRECLPFKVLAYPRSEADDIIGTLSLQTTDNTTIVSTDKDFLQLCSPTVTIYNPMKKMNVNHPDPKFFLIEQSFIGQQKDSIFNVKTPDDWPVGKRKPGFGPKAFEKAVEYGWKEWLKKEGLVENFKRNLNLMDLSRIPEEMKTGIMKQYNEYKYPHPDNIYKFVKNNNWPDMLESFTQVENRLMQLY